MNRSMAPAMLPLLALDLVRRFWAPLLFWFALGWLLHDLTLRGFAWIAQKQALLGYAGLSLSILILLVTTILMFHTVRGGLPGLRAADVGRDASGPPVPGGRAIDTEESVVDAVAHALLPFLIFYGAWGLFKEEVRNYGRTALNLSGDFELGFLDFGNTLADLIVPLIIAVVSFVARVLCERRWKRTRSKVLGVLAAVFEANWMFFAVVSVSEVVRSLIDWVTSRVAWTVTKDAIVGALRWFDGLLPFPFLDQLAALWQALAPRLGDGILQPLLWLTIATVVYRAGMRGQGAVVPRTFAGTRAEGLTGQWQRLPERARVYAELFSRELREKYTPFFRALGFALRAGPLLFLTFCLCYVALEAGRDWLWRGVAYLLGPHEFLQWWWVRTVPLDFAADALHELLRICLLAAAFDMTLRRAAGRAERTRTGAPFNVRSAGTALGPAASPAWKP